MNKQGATSIWNRNAGLESRSGVGSTKTQTKAFREFLTKVINEHNVKSIIDIGCGDWNWMSTVNLNNVTYRGVDIVEECVEQNKEKYERENITFEVLDITQSRIEEEFDLIICRDVLFHLTNEQQVRALHNFPESKFILTTSFNGVENVDLTDEEKKRGWGWRKINLEADPFYFSKPIDWISEPGQGNRIQGLWDFNEQRTGNKNEK